jgi:hypothetical protein
LKTEIHLTDPTLRLPTTTFRAVLDLGILPLDLPPLPRHFERPDIDVSLDEEAGTHGVYFNFADGQLHLEISHDQAGYHFHNASGEDSDESPWSDADTEAVFAWASVIAAHVTPLIPDLLEDVDEAAEWQQLGLPVYARDYEAVPLQIIEVEVEGELLMLPWLGSGHIDHQHSEGPDHPIVLLWNAEHITADTAIASAWTDPTTGNPKAEGRPGVDWTAVGLPEEEVLTWLEGLYLNHHVIADPASLIIRAALDRIAGIDN